MTKDEILRQIDESWAALNAALDGIPESALARPGVCGNWSITDLLGHIAFWDRQALEEARRRAAGEAPRRLDWQAMNEENAAANAQRDLADLKAEFDSVHAELVSTLGSLETLYPESIKVDTWEHYDEHAADIRGWREREAI